MRLPVLPMGALEPGVKMSGSESKWQEARTIVNQHTSLGSHATLPKQPICLATLYLPTRGDYDFNYVES